jgi:hypothetical protein
MNNRLFGIIALILGGISIPMFFPTTFYNALELHKIPASQTGNLLAQLVFYALVIERITEIFIDASFSGQKTSIKSGYIYEQRRVEAALKSFETMNHLEAESEKYLSLANSVTEAKEKLEAKKVAVKANERWLNLTGKVRLAAIIFSITLGILLALVGVRILGVLVPPIEGELPSKVPFQSSLRNATDVMITGLLLAGGAAGLHPIINQLKKFGHSEKN